MTMSKMQTKKGVNFEAEMWRYMKLRGVSSKEKLRLLTTIGSHGTIVNYFDNPELIPMGKLSEMMTALRIPKEDRARIINMLIEQ
jgi:hypothetical protein